MNTASELVANGCALLDEHFLGWAEKIDLSALSVASCDRCILGMLYGRYRRGLEALGPKSGDQYGFCINYTRFGDLNYEELDRVWTDEIAARRSEADDITFGQVRELAVA